MARAIYAPDQPQTLMADWSARIAFFAVALLLATFVLHRLFIVPTGMALNAAMTAFAGAGIALVMALIAGLDIWVTGRQGAARVIVGTTVALAVLAIPASVWSLARDYPEINDITTDTKSPPAFVRSRANRATDANAADYAGQAFAAKQASAYPDIRPIVIQRPIDDTYEVVLQALAKLRYQDLLQTPPPEDGNIPGIIEFTDTSLVFGFSDDVVIRVARVPDDGGTRIDVRSQSRYGRNDFGHNANRVRTLLTEIVGRLEASVPVAKSLDEDDAEIQKPSKAKSKRRSRRNPR